MKPNSSLRFVVFAALLKAAASSAFVEPYAMEQQDSETFNADVLTYDDYDSSDVSSAEEMYQSPALDELPLSEAEMDDSSSQNTDIGSSGTDTYKAEQMAQDTLPGKKCRQKPMDQYTPQYDYATLDIPPVTPVPGYDYATTEVEPATQTPDYDYAATEVAPVTPVPEYEYATTDIPPVTPVPQYDYAATEVAPVTPVPEYDYDYATTDVAPVTPTLDYDYASTEVDPATQTVALDSYDPAPQNAYVPQYDYAQIDSKAQGSEDIYTSNAFRYQNLGLFAIFGGISFFL